MHAYRGERDALLRWLEKANEARDPDLAAYQGDDPALAPFRGVPRYKVLLRKIHLTG